MTDDSGSTTTGMDTNDDACDDDQPADCLGRCGGSAVVDDCGVCDGNDASKDCAGVCHGSAVTDDCGVCNGNNASKDCSGVCGGTAIVDDCGVCEGNNASKDCLGVCGGTAVVDDCGQCDGKNTGKDCLGVCGGAAVRDDCDVCNGENASKDCLGICGGSAVIDDCGVCNGKNASKDCLGVCGGAAIIDDCSVCDGNNSSKDCKGVCGGDAVVDDCGVCDGNDANKDCFGNCGGPAELDDCGVCNGANASKDCAGTCGGTAVLDDCGVCGGDNSEKDCKGVCSGSAKLDDCGICGGNNASKDCRGTCGGPVEIDDCGVCGGNNLDKDCNGVCDGPAKLDDCGVCEGDNSSKDCNGLCGGTAKIDACGVCGGSNDIFDWTWSMETNNKHSANAIDVDAKGFIYVAGSTTGVMPGQESAGGKDPFLMKLSPTGQLLWIRQFGTLGTDYGADLAVNAQGVAVVVGETNGTIPGAVAAGGRDGYARAYDTDGEVLWSRQFGTTANDGADAVDFGPDGSVFVTGFGSSTTYLREITPAGDVILVDQFTPPASHVSCWPDGITIDDDGKIYLTGQTYGPISGAAHIERTDIYVRTYDAAVDEVWTRIFGSKDYDYASDIAFDSKGNIIVVGQAGAEIDEQPHAGNYDALVRGYDEDGAPRWTSMFGGRNSDSANAVAIDAGDNVHIGAQNILRRYDAYGNLTRTQTACGVTVRGLATDGQAVYVAGSSTAALFVGRMKP